MFQYWSDNDIITAIRQGAHKSNTALEFIYKAWRPYYTSVIIRMGGTIEDVQECLSWSLTKLERRVKNPEFRLQKVPLRVYFTAILKHEWFKFKKKEPIFEDISSFSTINNDYENDYWDIRQDIQELIGQMGEKCRKVLTFWYEGFTMREIATLVGLSSEQTAKNAKLNCHKTLIQLLSKL